MTTAARAHPLIAASSLLACVAVLFCLGAASAAAQTGGAQANRPGGLQRLWSTYPVRTKSAVSRPAAREKRRASAATDRGSSALPLDPVVLGFVSALAAAGVLVAVLFLRPRPALDRRRARALSNPPSPLLEGPTMNDLVSRLFKTSDEQPDKAKPSSAPTAAGADVRDEPEQKAELDAARTRAGEPEPDQASMEVGDQVATILSSAKQAAQRLQVSAREDAERIRGEAKQASAARLKAVERELAGKRQEGAKLRADAEAYSKSTRQAADRYAAETRQKIDEESAKRRKEAEREANEIRAAAKQRAEKLSSEGVRRQRALTAEAQRSEARLERLLGVFRALTSQLEDVLGEERATASSTEGRDLEKALRPQPLGDRRV
jgi:hypothetical protein